MKTISTTIKKVLNCLLLMGIFVLATIKVNAQKAYITNEGSNTVSVVDVASNSITATIPVGSTPFGVSVSSDGTKVYITNYGSNTVSVINTATNTVIGSPIIVGTNPGGVSVTPHGDTVYVANANSGTVSVINTVTNTVIGSPITVGLNPIGVSVTPNGTKVYVANNGSNTVSVINTATGTVSATITVGTSPQGLSVTPDGTKVYVTNSNSGNVSVINTVTDMVLGSPITVGSTPNGVSVTPHGDTVYVANANSGTVSVINTITDMVIGSPITVGSNPQGVSVSPDGTKVYVATFSAGTVSVINTATLTVSAPISGFFGPYAFGNFMGTPPSGGCTSAPAPPTITGPNAVCQMTSATYTATTIGASSYTWTVPTGVTGMTITSGQGTSSLNVSISAGNTNGNITVTATNACGTSAPAVLQITKKPQTPATISGPSDICGLLTTTYSIPATLGATSYNWTIPAGMTPSGTQISILPSITVSIASNFTIGTVKVMAVNACGSIPGTALTVYGKTAPNVITGSANVCGATTAGYSCSTVSNATSYIWTVPASWTFTGQGTTSIISTMPVNINNVTFAGQVKVQAVSGCGNSAMKVLPVSYCKSSISVNNSADGIISSIYPNPANTEFKMDVTLTDEQLITNNEQLTIHVYDVSGNLIISEKHPIAIGTTTLNTNIENYKAGIYFVRLVDGDMNTVYSQTMIKQ